MTVPIMDPGAPQDGVTLTAAETPDNINT